MGDRACSRCKRWAAQSGDSWCAGCTATEAVQTEWGKAWQPAYRRIAQDLVISTARQVRALRNLAAGLTSAVHQQATADQHRQRVTPAALVPGLEVSELRERASSEDPRGDLPRRRTTQPKTGPRPGAKVASQEQKTSSSYEETDDEPQEEIKKEVGTPPPPDPGHQPLPAGPRKPPGPDSADIDKNKRKRDPEPPKEVRLEERSGAHSKRERRTDRHRDRRRRPKHRAGRKHQRLYRLLEDPTQILHHKPGESFFALQEDWRPEEQLI